MRLHQIPFSHKLVKVRKALDLKGLAYETVDVNPLWRARLVRETGQLLVPALVDGDRTVADSTAILLHLEQAYPDPPLLPADPQQRAECMILEAWADGCRRADHSLAYWNIASRLDRLESSSFPRGSGRCTDSAGSAGPPRPSSPARNERAAIATTKRRRAGRPRQR